MDFVVIAVEQLSFVLLDPGPGSGNLFGHPLNFNGLEHNDKVKLIGKVNVLGVGDVGDAGSELGRKYFLRWI